MRVLLSLVLIFIFWLPSKAQRDEIGFMAGMMNYQGELSRYINIASPGMNGGVFVRQNWNEAFSTKYSFLFGQINDADSRRGDDDFARARNHEFRTGIFELGAQAEYNFLHFRNPNEQQLWTPYLLAGISVFKMSPQGEFNPPYNLFQLAIPLGVGIKFVAGANWNMGLEFSARKTFTDALDNIYTSPQRNPKYYTGNPYDQDWYFTTNLTVSYTFYSSPCPRFYRF